MEPRFARATASCHPHPGTGGPRPRVTVNNNPFTKVTRQDVLVYTTLFVVRSISWHVVGETLSSELVVVLGVVYGLVRLLGLVVAHLTSIHRRVVDTSRTIRVHAPAVHTIS